MRMAISNMKTITAVSPEDSLRTKGTSIAKRMVFVFSGLGGAGGEESSKADMCWQLVTTSLY